MTTPKCKCSRYISPDGKPCFCAPWWVRGLWSVRAARIRRGRAARIEANSRQCFMGGVLPSERRGL